MSSPARRASSVLVLVVGLLASLVLAIAPATTAQAANDKGLVNGNIIFPQKDSPGIKMLWFDANWNYLGSKSAGGGGYSIWLAPGTYHLQFVDQRPAYEIKKYAPTDIQVTVRANDLTNKDVRMQKGGAITGTATAGGKPLKNARIVAANKSEQSFATTANKKGQFAIGGLPQGQYSIFTFDDRKTWVGKSAFAGSVKPGQVKNMAVKLTKKAGSMTVYLFTPDGRLNAKTSVTVTSKKTGQWWTATANNGTAVFKGLYPGGYTLKFDGAGVWFAKTGSVQQASVKSGKMAFGSFHLTKRGGWVTGSVVDGGDQDAPTDFDMKGVEVGLYNADGQKVASTTTDDEGNFKLTGQLATQAGLTVTVDPNPNSGGWMQAAPPDNWCLFEGGSLEGVAITEGQESEVGPLPLPRSTSSAQANQCLI